MVPIRRLPLENVKNMRDLGGYSTQSGKTTQFGRLFRSDAPTALSEKEVRILLDLGVCAAVDLRSGEETEKRPSALKEVAQITYFHCPMAIGNRTPKSKEEVPSLYWEIVADYPAMNLIMRIIANQTGAVIFHCTSGKDRTGIVSAILLLLTGVSRSDILADYQVSYTYVREDIRALLEREPERPPFTGLSDIEYMDKLLDRFEAVYGTAAHYLKEIGLSRDEIHRLENKLIDEV
jgi:protein-tyrosine phosphatase